MSFKLPFLLGPVFFRTAIPCSGDYHLEMQLHDEDRVNCEKGATTVNQGAGVKYLGEECMYHDCVCYLT